MADRRQALILIHGIGEQRPMDTLKTFVDAVLDQPSSTSQVDAKYYSKPDFLSGNYELRRLVSAGSRDSRTDFYEYYWAHLMPTATWNRLAGWYWVLMFRRPPDVPKRLLPVWALSWITLIIAVTLGIYATTRFVLGQPVAPGLLDKAPWFLLAVLGAVSATIRGYAGDAAVYLSPSPANIEARRQIRALGLDLLDKVASSGRYDRIILVGHSLGSVIGYDILSLAWQRQFDAARRRLSEAWKRGELPKVESGALRKAELLAKDLRSGTGDGFASAEEWAGKWRRATWNVAAEQQKTAVQLKGDSAWLVSDFVTLGSPLTHADLLLARSPEDFVRRTQERELPQCPPVRELNGRFSFDHKDTDDQRRLQKATVLNSAALFATTAWTNLYFPSFAILRGDFVGGPVAPLFQMGVRDVPLKTNVWGGLLAHTHYWRRDKRDKDLPDGPLNRLREALDLERKRPWPSFDAKPTPVPHVEG